MESEFNFENHYKQIKIAAIIAIILGLAIAVIFIVFNAESYSALYIVPGSIIHNPGDNLVSFSYGVKSFELKTTDYTLITYLNDKQIKTKQFSLNNGEILDERDAILLPPDAKYPLKISLHLITNTATEEVHFWVK
jgi:hypothetical protein